MGKRMSPEERQRWLADIARCNARAARRRAEGSQNTVGTFPKTRRGGRKPKSYDLVLRALEGDASD